ncbi:MAG TPA: hypothetical protein VGI81_08270 [Tepidisphaeraceae bacterium]|jgi:hypothetical protein
MGDEPKEHETPVPLEYQSASGGGPQRLARGLGDVLSGLCGGISCFFFVSMLLAALSSIFPAFKPFAAIMLVLTALGGIALAFRAARGGAALGGGVDYYNVAFWTGAAAMTFGMAAFFAIR